LIAKYRPSATTERLIIQSLANQPISQSSKQKTHPLGPTPWPWRHDEWPPCPASLGWAAGVCLPATHLAEEEVGKTTRGLVNVDIDTSN